MVRTARHAVFVLGGKVAISNVQVTWGKIKGIVTDKELMFVREPVGDLSVCVCVLDFHSLRPSRRTGNDFIANYRTTTNVNYIHTTTRVTETKIKISIQNHIFRSIQF